MTVEVTDAAGNTYSEAINITVDDSNGDPVWSVPIAQSVDEDNPLVFSSANGNALALTDGSTTESPY